MDGADELPQRDHPEKKPCADVDCDSQRGSPTPTVVAVAGPVSKVLGDDNLLGEILIRLGFPTALVVAALVCRSWYHHASDHGFLRRFRELHPPRLLGFHVFLVDNWSGRAFPRFVPMLPQPLELATVVRRMANHKFDDHKLIRIMDSRNASLFTIEGRGLVYEVQRPLCPERGIAVVPPLPIAQDPNRPFFGSILSKEEGSSLSYFYVLSELTNATENFMVRVYMLQGSVWCLHTSATDQLHHPLPRGITVLVDNKIYMAASFTDDIIVLDLTASSFSRIQLPCGMKYYSFNTILSRADDPSGVYLIHVHDFKLCIWLLEGGNWLLVNTICLHEMCANMRMLDNTLEDEHTGCCYISQAGDNAEFVFLKMCGCVLYLDVKNRTLRKVLATAQKDQHFGAIYPFMMVWPPTFPALKDGPARIAM